MAGAILAHHDEHSYATALTDLKFYAPNWRPKEVMVRRCVLAAQSSELVQADFELALHDGIKEAFPAAKIRGCMYHHMQCIDRNLDSACVIY